MSTAVETTVAAAHAEAVHAQAAHVQAGPAAEPTLDDIWEILRGVPDPEIPVISIVDLGIVRSVRWEGLRNETLAVTLTPTYCGCPATAVISADVARALESAGIARPRIETSLSPPWTTDWMSAAARERLAEYGIAPPGARGAVEVASVDISRLGRRTRKANLQCPRCQSTATELVSRFGSTPCKAQYRCRTCLEPFDHFKPH